jgi:hypothetical protein
MSHHLIRNSAALFEHGIPTVDLDHERTQAANVVAEESGPAPCRRSSQLREALTAYTTRVIS